MKFISYFFIFAVPARGTLAKPHGSKAWPFSRNKSCATNHFVLSQICRFFQQENVSVRFFLWHVCNLLWLGSTHEWMIDMDKKWRIIDGDRRYYYLRSSQIRFVPTHTFWARVCNSFRRSSRDGCAISMFLPKGDAGVSLVKIKGAYLQDSRHPLVPESI